MMLRVLLVLPLLAFAACEFSRPTIIASNPEISLKPRDGEVRLVDVRLGVAHLEATCDPGTSAICSVYAARWCQNPPKVYDQQKYFTGANGQERTVYLASCDPRV